MTLEEYFKLIPSSVSERDVMIRQVYVGDLDEPDQFESFPVQSVNFITMIDYDYRTERFIRNTDLSKTSNLKVTLKDDEVYHISIDKINSFKIIKGDEFPFDKKEVLEFIKKKTLRAIVEVNI